jgi:ankyrin repeat protein
VVRLLVDKGADVNVQGGRTGNALQAASERGHEAVVRLLLDKGADVNATSTRRVEATAKHSTRLHLEATRRW